MMKNYYVYILKCVDSTYYTGVSNNLERRLIEHTEGLVKTCYTFKRRPVELKFYERFTDINLAIVWEKKLKKWSKKKKEALIEEHYYLLKDLSKKRF